MSENLPLTPDEQPSQVETPIVRGFIVFLELGTRQLANLLRRFDTTRCRILFAEMLPKSGTGLLKLAVTYPEEGRTILERAGLPIAEYTMLGVILPEAVQPILRVVLPLIGANITVYATHLVPLAKRQQNVLLLEVDSIARAGDLLLAHGFALVGDAVLANDA